MDEYDFSDQTAGIYDNEDNSFGYKARRLLQTCLLPIALLFAFFGFAGFGVIGYSFLSTWLSAQNIDIGLSLPYLSAVGTCAAPIMTGAFGALSAWISWKAYKSRDKDI